MADIGEPIRHRRVIPVHQPIPDGNEPALPKPPARVPEKEREKVPADR